MLSKDRSYPVGNLSNLSAQECGLLGQTSCHDGSVLLLLAPEGGHLYIGFVVKEHVHNPQ